MEVNFFRSMNKIHILFSTLAHKMKIGNKSYYVYIVQNNKLDYKILICKKQLDAIEYNNNFYYEYIVANFIDLNHLDFDRYGQEKMLNKYKKNPTRWKLLNMEEFVEIVNMAIDHIKETDMTIPTMKSDEISELQKIGQLFQKRLNLAN